MNENIEFAVDAVVRVADEGDDLWRVVKYTKGWYTLSLLESPEVTLKARHADMELVSSSELDEIEETEEEAEARASRMAEQLKKYRSKYTVCVAKSGKKSLNNGDPVAQALEYLDWSEVMALCCSLLALDYAELEAKYAHLNIGARRMNCGNRIRSAYKKGNETVVRWVDQMAATNAKSE